MSSAAPANPTATKLQLTDLGWPADLVLAGCGECQLVALLPPDDLDSRCFHCGSTLVEPIDPTTDLSSHLAPAELMVDQRLKGPQAAGRLQEWRRGFRLRPGDATHSALVHRLRLVFVPIWLMDSTVLAPWQGEAGYDYQVESHRESFSAGMWNTQKVQRTKQDWERRVGRLNRRFDNVPAEGLEREVAFTPLARPPVIGMRTVHEAGPYTAEGVARATVCLPQRAPQDAAIDLGPLLMALAKEQVQTACRADQLRNFEWAPELTGQNWTKMLYPIWSTWYLDDDQRPRMVYINGVTGHGLGEQVPSMRRAWLISSIFIGLAALLSITGLVLGWLAGSLASFFTLIGFGVLLLLFPLVMILFVIYQQGRPDQFRPF